jgi:hypothetical protein
MEEKDPDPDPEPTEGFFLGAAALTMMNLVYMAMAR